MKVLDKSVCCTNPTSKWVCLMCHPSTFRQKELDLGALAKEALKALQAAEDKRIKMRMSLIISSSLVRIPSSSANPGSRWAAVEQT